LTPALDDGIVVYEVKPRTQWRNHMPAVELGVDLRERLGAEGSSQLVEAFKVAQNDMLTIATERFEARLTGVAAEMRGEMASLKSDLRQEIAAGAPRCGSRSWRGCRTYAWR
jgi:hypothetical protein